MGPIAAKVLRDIRKARRGQVIDLAAVRSLRELAHLQAEDPAAGEILPPHHAQWLAAFKVLAPFAHALLSTDALRKVAQHIEAAEQEFMPGGPPMSPVFDSVFSTWSLADIPIGPRRETLCSIIVDLAPALGIAPVLSAAARMLAASRLGVFRVREVGEDRVQLTDLYDAQSVQALVPKDMRNRTELWLTRLLPPLHGGADDFVVWTTPYHLGGQDAEQAWLSYGERVVTGSPEAERRSRLAEHFKSLDKPRRWLDYITDAYAGVTQQGVVVLTGIADKPETLPHHASYDPAKAADPKNEASPLERLRLRIQHLASQAGFPDARAELAESDTAAARIMEIAYRMYGQLDQEGRTALDLIADNRVDLPEPERRMLDALLMGWFSVFQIQRIKVDEGMQLRDALTKRSVWITEKSATRQVQLGDVVFGWLTVESDATRLEGAVGHVPERLTKGFLTGMRKQLSSLRKTYPALDWKKQHGLLALRAVELTERTLAEAPPPRMLTSDGYEMIFSEARYEVPQLSRAAELLSRSFQAGPEPNSFAWIVGGIVHGMLVLSANTLVVQCSCCERLNDLKTKLNRELGESIVHRVDAFEDPSVLTKRAARSGSTTPKQAPELPPGVAQQVQAVLLQRMRAWLDEPIPMLGGKSPRQAVRTERGRDDVTHMLIQQQRMFDSGPGMPKLDLSEIWRALGLSPRL